MNAQNNLKLSISNYLNIGIKKLNPHIFIRKFFFGRRDVCIFPQQFQKLKKDSTVVYVHVLLYDEIWTSILSEPNVSIWTDIYHMYKKLCKGLDTNYWRLAAWKFKNLTLYSILLNLRRRVWLFIIKYDIISSKDWMTLSSVVGKM